MLDGFPAVATPADRDVGDAAEAGNKLFIEDTAFDADSVVSARLRHKGSARALDRARPRLHVAPRLVGHPGRHVVADADEWAVWECPKKGLPDRRELHGVLGANDDAQWSGCLSHDICVAVAAGCPCRCAAPKSLQNQGPEQI